MERDMKLIAAILECLAAHPEPWMTAPRKVHGFDDLKIVAYHVDLCYEAGFVRRKKDAKHILQLT